MLLLEHGDERPNLCLAETRPAGLERATEVKREIAMALRDACAGRSRRGDLIHDITRNGITLSSRPSSICSWAIPLYGPDAAIQPRAGLNAYTFPQPTT